MRIKQAGLNEASQLLQKTEAIILDQNRLENALKQRELEVVSLQQEIEHRRLKDLEKEALKSARRKEKEEASIAKKAKKAKSAKSLWKSKPKKRLGIYIYVYICVFGYVCGYSLYHTFPLCPSYLPCHHSSNSLS